MNLILHQAATDFRAQRWLVAAWAAMLVAACSIEALQVEASLVYPLLALSVGRVVLGSVLAIRIVHADPLDGTSAFWLTRPLSPRMLLAAKAGLIGVLLFAVPAIATLVVFIMNGFAVAALPVTLAQWLLIEALPLLPIVLIATLTRDVARLVLALLVGLAAWCALQLFWRTWTMLPVELGAVSEWQTRVAQAWFVVGGGVVALCSALIARHYLARRTAGVAFAALVGAVGIAAIAALWPTRLMIEYRPSWDEPGAEAASTGWRGADAIQVTVPADSLRVLSGRNGVDQLVGDLHITGLGEDLVVHTAGGHGTLRFSGRSDVVEQRRSYAIGLGAGPVSLADAASRSHFERVLSGRLGDRFPPSLGGLRLVEAKQGVFANPQGSPATYDATLTFDAYRVRTPAVVPLKAGAVVRVGDVVTTLLSIRKEPTYSGWVIDVRLAMPKVGLSGDGLGVVRYLRNRKRSEAIRLAGVPDGVPLAGLTSTCILAVRRAETPETAGVSIDAAWLADAELVFVSFERLGRFTKHVTIPSFVLPPAR